MAWRWSAFMSKADIVIHSNLLPNPGTVGRLPVRQDVAFTNHRGEEKSRIRKRVQKALEKLQDPIARFLDTDESVLFVVARCNSPATGLEQYLLGAYAGVLAGTTLVLTNRRLLHFRVKSNGSWTGSVRAVHWGDVSEGRVKGWLSKTMELVYRGGKKEKYWQIRRDDGKKLKAILERVLPDSAGEMTSTLQMVSLCPDCKAALTPEVYECPACRKMFRNPGTMLTRTILIPGGGHFYCGHKLLGLAHALVEVIFLLALAALTLELLGYTRPGPGEEPASWAMIVIVLAFLGLEKAVGWYMCRRFIREFIPAT